MTLTTEIKGTFANAIEINLANLEEMLDRITPSDQKNEVRSALEEGTETTVYYASYTYPGEAEARCYVLFPMSGRGGCALGGYTAWCDASTLDEIEAAWENDGMDS